MKGHEQKLPFSQYLIVRNILKLLKKEKWKLWWLKTVTWPFQDITWWESPAFATRSWLFWIIATQDVLPEFGLVSKRLQQDP